MRPSRRPIVIATRRSKLAMAQSQAVARALRRLHPSTEVSLLPIDSDGDRLANHSLAAHGGKGLFTRAIERAVVDGRADIAVHSLKDLPVHENSGLVIAAMPARGEVRDVLISSTATTLDDLEANATVGTSSPRRAAQLLRHRADLRIQPLRGNVDTRLAKVLDHREVDATLLAAVGLQRSGLGEYAQNLLPVERMMPAAGQGVLAIQCRADDHVTLRRCLPLNDAITAAAAEAERHLVAELGADCHSSIAVLAEPAGPKRLRLRVRVLDPDGRQCLEADQTDDMPNLRHLCDRLSVQLLNEGAARLLQMSAQHMGDLL